MRHKEEQKGKLWSIMLVHIKQMIAVGLGEAPAFSRFEQGQTNQGPFKACQDLLITLNPDGHYPVIMQPSHLNDQISSVYYSLSSPSLFAPRVDAPKSWSKLMSSLLDLYDGPTWRQMRKTLSLSFELHIPVEEEVEEIGTPVDSEDNSVKKPPRFASELWPEGIAESRMVKNHDFIYAFVKISRPAGSEVPSIDEKL
jgi:hypothetical protein